MDMIKFKKMKTPEEVELFWLKKREYDQKDLFPHLDEEAREYFSGSKYYDAIMDLHQNAAPGGRTLELVFFYDKQDTYLGFAIYKIYTNEDGKAIILEFCIDHPFRNRGLGTKINQEFEKLLESEGATYFTLNTSNDNNRRFWERNGYVMDKPDEWGEMVYVKGRFK